MKIKTIIATYECKKCGSLLFNKRDIIIDEYLKKLSIEIPTVKCPCGSSPKQFKILDLEIKEKEIMEKIKE